MSTKSLTKAQLTDELIALRLHCQRIETELASLKAGKPALSPRAAYVHQRTAEQQATHAAYMAACAAARQEAMSSGKSVRVG